MSNLPSEWLELTLGEVADWGSGGTPTAGRADYYGGDIPWAVIGDLDDGPLRTTSNTITAKGLAESSAKIVPEGSVLIAMYGSIGKLGLPTGVLATNQAIAFAVPKAGVLDRGYLFWYLMHQRDALSQAGKGVAQKNISQTILKAWPITFPPLDEQRRIVAILEDHLTRLEVADSSLSAIARLSPLFARSGTHSALTSVPVEWRPLSAVLDGIEAGKSFTCLPRTSEKGEWGVIKVSAMTWGEFRPEENKAVPPGKGIDERFQIRRGDILVSRANTEQYVGAPVIVREQPDRLLLSDKSLRLLLAAGVDREWLIAALQGPSTRRQISALATGTKDSMRNISQGALMSVEVPVPIHEVDQQTVTNAVTVCREAGEHLDSARTGLNRRRDALRRSLLAAAFSGQLTKESSVV